MPPRQLTRDEIEAVRAKARERAKARRPTAIVDISVDPVTDANGMPVVRISYLGDRVRR
jgi:hypothetical protein